MEKGTHISQKKMLVSVKPTQAAPLCGCNLLHRVDQEKFLFHSLRVVAKTSF